MMLVFEHQLSSGIVALGVGDVLEQLSLDGNVFPGCTAVKGSSESECCTCWNTGDGVEQLYSP